MQCSYTQYDVRGVTITIKTLSTCVAIVFVTVSLLIFMPDNSELFDPSFYYDTSAAKKMVVAAAAWGQSSDRVLIWNEDTGRNEYQPAPLPNGGGSGNSGDTDYPSPANAYFPLLDPRNTGYTINAHPDSAVTASNAPAPPGVLGYNGTVSGAHQGTDLGTHTQEGKRYQDLYQPSDFDTVHAVKAGVVVTVEDSGSRGYGYHVMLAHKDGTLTLYGHMVTGSSGLKAGDTVSAGQIIGRRGNTGRSTGPHLHLETRTTGSVIDLSKVAAYRSVFYATATPMHNTYIQALNLPASVAQEYSMSSILKEEIPPDLWATYDIS